MEYRNIFLAYGEDAYEYIDYLQEHTEQETLKYIIEREYDIEKEYDPLKGYCTRVFNNIEEDIVGFYNCSYTEDDFILVYNPIFEKIFIKLVELKW